MNRLVRGFSIVTLLLLAGCDEVKIEDGRIPAEYLDEAAAATGTYAGTMDSRAVSLNVSLIGDRLRVQASPDFLGTGCDSSFGNLEKVRVEREGNSYSLESATFAFAPNFCAPSVVGREVVFGIRSRNGQTELSASLLQDSRMERECRMVCSPGGPGGAPVCREECTMRPIQVFLTGRFYKRS